MDTTPSSTDTTTQATEQLRNTLTEADSNVAQGVQALAQVHQARLSRATRTVAALTAQFGAGDPRVKVAQASVTAINTAIARVSIVNQQLATPDVQVAAAGWALQGYVLDTQYKPMAKFTVFLVDASHRFQSQYGFSYTDSNGYFLINYPGSSASGTGTAGSSTQNPAPPQLFIAVVNADANPVYLGATAFQPTVGTVTFQNIVLPAGAPILGDPTIPIRDVAFPVKGAPPSGTPPASPKP